MYSGNRNCSACILKEVLIRAFGHIKLQGNPSNVVALIIRIGFWGDEGESPSDETPSAPGFCRFSVNGKVPQRAQLVKDKAASSARRTRAAPWAHGPLRSPCVLSSSQTWQQDEV